MRKLFPKLPMAVAYFFTILFCYASFSKMLDFENFQIQLAQSPLLSAYAGFISYAVIIAEFVIVALLCIKGTRLIGLYLSLGIMVSFTIYIYLILNYSDFVPCSCGGILEKLGWTEHLIFNIACIVFAFVGIYILSLQRDGRKLAILISTGSMSFLSAGVVVLLFFFSENIIKKENNFTRRFLLHPVIEDKVLDLGLNSYTFAGSDKDEVYLGNVTTPLILTKVDSLLSKTSKMKIELDNSSYPYRNLQIQVNSPHYYLYDGSVPIIYRGFLGNPSAHTISYGDAYFTQLSIIDSSKFAVRTQNSKNKQYTLASLYLTGKIKVKQDTTILKRQVDGVFDSDGRLIKNGDSKELIYTYAYRNQILVLDTNLKVLRNLHTIDTTTIARIEATELSDGRHKMSAPPVMVNKFTTAGHGLLFNQSNLMGKHESNSKWKKATIVDVYKTDRQEYVGSFYIYHRKGAKMSQMFAAKKYLYVLCGNEIIRYRFSVPFSKYFKVGDAENLSKSRQNHH